MFPAERPSLLNTVARSIMGRASVLHGGSLSHLMDEVYIRKNRIYLTKILDQILNLWQY